MGKVLFTSSGTEAVEAALKLGRAATKRTRVLSAEHGFHGLTLGSLSINGAEFFRERCNRPHLSEFSRQVRMLGRDSLDIHGRPSSRFGQKLVHQRGKPRVVPMLSVA